MSEVFLKPDYPDVIAQWKEFFALLELADGSRVLDVGSHLGDAPRLLTRMYPNVDQVVGVEKNPQRYKAAIERNSLFPEIRKVKFYNCDGTELPFEDESFDAAYCVDTIEWVDDKSALLDEVHRVLKPSGVFLLAHADFETQAILTDDPVYTQRVIISFTNLGKNGRIGRELSVICKSSRFRSCEPGVYVIIDESFDEQTYARYICSMMSEWIREAGDEAVVPLLDQWISHLENRHTRREFFYSINKYWCRCRK